MPPGIADHLKGIEMAISPKLESDSVARLIDQSPMSRTQILAVAMAVALNALDGFDVLAITFAAPGIARDWGIGPASLGAALSAGLAGMTLGSFLLSPLGDRFGRRPLILGSLVLMTIGMGLTATATNIVALCVWRVVTGFGIGGMLATINAVAAEFSNQRRRDFSVAVMTVGLPIGGLIGGFAVADLVVPYGWQSVFVLGAIVTGIFLPLAWFLLPESLGFLGRQGTPEARARIDTLLARMGHPPLVGDLPPVEKAERRGSFTSLLSPRYRRTTLVLVGAYFFHIVTFYFFSGWLPKMMTDLGFTQPDAIRTSALMSLGGVIGGSLLGWAAPRLGLVRLLVGAMVGTSATFVAFGAASGLAMLQVIAFFAGVCVYGGIVGLYALLARGFPAELRVTGTGVAVGVGRGGAIIAPTIGGVLIAGGMSIPLAIAVVGTSALVAAGLMIGSGSLFDASRLTDRD